MKWLKVNKMMRKAMMLSGGVVMGVGNLNNCEPAVQNAVVEGLQSASENLITGLLNALFLSFTPEEVVTTTVRAIFNELPSFLA